MGEYTGKKVVVTGVRDIHPDDPSIVYRKLLAIVQDGAGSVIIGGARGVDTAAFIACAKPMKIHKVADYFELVVVVPGYLHQAPAEFRDAVEASGLPINTPEPSSRRITLVELGLDVSEARSYHMRNDVMLARAGWEKGRLVAFPGIGREHLGGTGSTIRQARRYSMDIDQCPVRVTT